MNDSARSRLWTETLERYKGKLSDDDVKEIEKTTDPNALLEALAKIGPSAQTSSNTVSDIRSGFERLGKLILVFGSAIPEVSAIVWGSLNLLYQRSAVSKDVRAFTIATIQDFCQVTPRLKTYEKVFKDMGSVEMALLNLYQGILDFFVEALNYVKRCSKKSHSFGPLPAPIQVKRCLENIQNLKISVEQEAFAANVNLHYNWHEEIKEHLSKTKIEPQGSLPCSIVPYPTNPHFQGRAEILKELELNLAFSKPGQRSFALYGLGGVGKTQIALKYIYDHIDDFPGVLWMHADSQTKLLQSYIDAAKRLKLEPEDSARDAEAISSILKMWLSQVKDQWLVVFDNADNLDILKPFWPPSNHGTIIITSRDPTSAHFAKKGMQVSPLPAQEGEQLFLSLVRPSGLHADQDDEATARQIVKQLGFLPLAINQVAQLVLECDCSLEDFVMLYKDAQGSDDFFSQLDVSTSNLFYEHSLATVWRISLESLHPDSSTLIAILAMYDPDGIPEMLLRERATNVPELAFLSDTRQYLKATSELHRRGLITKINVQARTEASEPNSKVIRCITIHRLIQEQVFHGQNQAAQNSTFNQASMLLQRRFPQGTRNNFRLMDRWNECERYLPHVLALEARCHDSPTLQLVPQLAELFFWAAWYLYERRLPELSIPLFKSAQRVCEANTTVDPIVRSKVPCGLGCVLVDLSQFSEAEKYFAEVIEIRQSVLDADDVLLAHAYCDMGLVLAGQGEYEKSIESFQRALAVVEKCDDDFTRRDMMFHIHHNMARAYEALGNPVEALRLHLYQGDEQGNGLRKENTASGAVNLYAIGNCYFNLGDSRGVDYHIKALKIREALVGDDYLTAISLHKMGVIMYQGGSLEEASLLLERAKGMFESSTDAKREVSRTAFHWSLVKRSLGMDDDANLLEDEAWNLRIEIEGGERVDQSGSLGFDQLVIYLNR